MKYISFYSQIKMFKFVAASLYHHHRGETNSIRTHHHNYYTEAAQYVAAGASGCLNVDPSYIQKCNVCEKLSYTSIYNLEENLNRPVWMRTWIESMSDNRAEIDKDIYTISEVLHIPFNSCCGVACCFDKTDKMPKK